MELFVPTHFTYDRQAADKNEIMHKEVSLLMLCYFSAVKQTDWWRRDRVTLRSGNPGLLAINLWRFSSTIAYCLAIRGVGGCYCNTGELLGYKHYAFLRANKGKIKTPGKNRQGGNELWKTNRMKKRKGRGRNFFDGWKFPMLFRR